MTAPRRAALLCAQLLRLDRSGSFFQFRDLFFERRFRIRRDLRGILAARARGSYADSYARLSADRSFLIDSVRRPPSRYEAAGHE